METLYARLGIDPSATQDDVKRAYRKLAVRMHPDKGGDEDAFAEIVEAYEVLCDDRRREIYDVVGLDGLRMYAALASMHSSSDTLPPLAVVASGAVLGVTAVVLLLSFVAMAAAKHDGRAESVPVPERSLSRRLRRRHRRDGHHARLGGGLVPRAAAQGAAAHRCRRVRAGGRRAVGVRQGAVLRGFIVQ